MKGFSVGGNVLWSKGGKPMAGAEIFINKKSVTRTGADGTFHLESMRAGNYLLSVKMSKFLFGNEGYPFFLIYHTNQASILKSLSMEQILIAYFFMFLIAFSRSDLKNLYVLIFIKICNSFFKLLQLFTVFVYLLFTMSIVYFRNLQLVYLSS